jgi:hypothetical protein
MSADHFKRLRDVFRATYCGRDGDFHPAGKEVIQNLRVMTGYGSSPFRPDPVSMAYQVGMQDVFRHIMQMLNISDADIYRMTATQPEEGYFTDAD